jgi:hypothetical protein
VLSDKDLKSAEGYYHEDREAGLLARETQWLATQPHEPHNLEDHLYGSVSPQSRVMFRVSNCDSQPATLSKRGTNDFPAFHAGQPEADKACRSPSFVDQMQLPSDSVLNQAQEVKQTAVF